MDHKINDETRPATLDNVVPFKALSHGAQPVDEHLADAADAPLVEACTAEGSTNSIETLRNYWMSLADGNVPERLSIDPRKIQSILPSVFLLERIAPEQACLRIAGQEICDLLSMDMRGLPLGCLFTSQGRGDMRWAIRQVFDGPAGVELSLRGQRMPMMWRAPVGRMLILPLCDSRGVSRAIGAIDFPGMGTKRQQAFDVADMQSEGVTLRNEAQSPVDAAFAKADALRDKTRSRPTGKPALRLVKSGHPVDLS